MFEEVRVRLLFILSGASSGMVGWLIGSELA